MFIHLFAPLTPGVNKVAMRIMMTKKKHKKANHFNFSGETLEKTSIIKSAIKVKTACFIKKERL
jgi:hypothetical protein